MATFTGALEQGSARSGHCASKDRLTECWSAQARLCCPGVPAYRSPKLVRTPFPVLRRGFSFGREAHEPPRPWPVYAPVRERRLPQATPTSGNRLTRVLSLRSVFVRSH